MMSEQRQVLLNKNRAFSRCASNAHDELHSFRSWLRWICVDQSDSCAAFLSWFVFFAFAIVVPAISHFGSLCDSLHTRPFDAVVQISLSAVASLSFVCLSTFVKNYGLRRFLFFDRLREESETVRKEYTLQLNRSLSMLFVFVLPGLVVESAYKIWWYASGGTRIPFLGNLIVSNTVACILELCSWFYRTVVFFLVCILFRLICYLQILRMKDFALVFLINSDVESVLVEHNRIRRHLRIISHRYRSFILLALIFITASLFASLLVTTRPGGKVSILHGGELALCSLSLLAGLMILLRSAARITHKAQAVTALAAKWHVCATINSFDAEEAETPLARNNEVEQGGFSNRPSYDSDEARDEEDEVDNTNVILTSIYSPISFQKRQALVTYFENNRAGITVYGFMLDRSSLHTIFGIELSLVLWLLGKTVGIS